MVGVAAQHAQLTVLCLSSCSGPDSSVNITCALAAVLFQREILVTLKQLRRETVFCRLIFVIGMDIIINWLISIRHRVKRVEYILTWLSFASTLALTTLLPVQVRRATVGFAAGREHCDVLDVKLVASLCDKLCPCLHRNSPVFIIASCHSVVCCPSSPRLAW
jgi:hypothetical protein